MGFSSVVNFLLASVRLRKPQFKVVDLRPIPDQPYELLPELNPGEEVWKKEYAWLKGQEGGGYTLRDRYDPSWKPSKDNPDDLVPLSGGSFNDAIRESDKQPVLLKVVSEDYHPDEVRIARKLNTAPLDEDPDNPSLRLHNILERRETPDFPGLKVLVFQLLPPACQPDFQTVGEVLDFVGQILMGVRFLHDNKIAIRSLKIEDILMDTTGRDKTPQTQRYHRLNQKVKPHHRDDVPSECFMRTHKQPRYYFCNFEDACFFDDAERETIVNRTQVAERGPQVTAIPNPDLDLAIAEETPVQRDIYVVGKLLQDHLIGSNASWSSTGYRNLGFLRPILNSMTDPNPFNRPNIHRVISLLESKYQEMSPIRLRARVPRRGEGLTEWMPRALSHWKHQVLYAARHVSPSPSKELLERMKEKRSVGTGVSMMDTENMV